MTEISMHKPIRCNAALAPSYNYRVIPIFQCPRINAELNELNFRAKKLQACTELCKVVPAKLREFLEIFPKMADWQEEAGLSSLAGLRRENSNMQESFYTTLYMVV